MAWAAIVQAAIQGTSAIVGGVSAYQRSRAQAKTLRALGKSEARDRELEGKRLLASQRVAFAKGGVDIGTGVPVDVAASTAAREALAAKRIRYAYGSAAKEAKLEGTSALLGGLLLGSASAISSASRLGSSARGSGAAKPATGKP